MYKCKLLQNSLTEITQNKSFKKYSILFQYNKTLHTVSKLNNFNGFYHHRDRKKTVEMPSTIPETINSTLINSCDIFNTLTVH